MSKLIKKIKTKLNKDFQKDYITYRIPKNYYKDLIEKEKIDNIIQKMPENLNELEKAYYIYIELGKILSERTKFVFSESYIKDRLFNDKIDENFEGICKSISELYVSVLKDKRVNISAECVKQVPMFQYSHIDAVIKIDGKKYLVNLISDLSRIKTSRKIQSFGIDLNRHMRYEMDEVKNREYLERLEDYYGKIDCLDWDTIVKMDKKLGYSFFVPGFMGKDKPGLYTEDTISVLYNEIKNPQIFNEYVLHGKDVPYSEILKYKIDYLIENIEKITEFNGKMKYLENIRYYLKLSEKLLSEQEKRRIHTYAISIDNNLSNIISIIKVDSVNKDKQNNNIYYMYSEKDNRYIEKTPLEMKEFFDSLEGRNTKIVGSLDRRKDIDIKELEI